MRRHSADVVSLSFGLFFVGIGLVLLSGGSGALSMAWVGPLVAMVMGGILLWAARSIQRRADDPSPRE